jgi:hypothetical protein
MLHKEIQKLLDYILENGQIDAEQKEFLIRKAKEVNQDIDILEMIIETENKKRLQHNGYEIQSNFSCPSCGSLIPRSSIKCGFCKFELSRLRVTGENYIHKLSEALTKIDQNHYDQETKLTASQIWSGAGDRTGQKMAQAKASAISTFTMPNDKENLLEFFYFCDTNSDSCFASAKSVFSWPEKSNFNTLGNSWAGKAKLAFDKLKRFENEDLEIKELIENYKGKYFNDPSRLKAAPTMSNQGGGKAVLMGLNQNGVILFFILLVLCFPTCWLPFVIPSCKAG